MDQYKVNFEYLYFPVIEVSSGEYGNHVDNMVMAVENGRSHKWRDFVIDERVEDPDDMDIEQLNSGPPQEHQYKYYTSPIQQFFILLKRMLLQFTRNKVIDF